MPLLSPLSFSLFLITSISWVRVWSFNWTNILAPSRLNFFHLVSYVWWRWRGIEPASGQGINFPHRRTIHPLCSKSVRYSLILPSSTFCIPFLLRSFIPSFFLSPFLYFIYTTLKNWIVHKTGINFFLIGHSL